MESKKILIGSGVALLAVVILLNPWEPKGSTQEVIVVEELVQDAPITSGGNELDIPAQIGGDQVYIELVSLETPGFIVVFEADSSVSDGLGRALGWSSRLAAADHRDIRIGLDKAYQEKQVVAALHLDSNNNGAFDAGVDAVMTDSSGNPLTMKFILE